MFGRLVIGLLLVGAIVAPGFAGGPFPITGTYLRDLKCTGSGTAHPSLLVKISSSRIDSQMGHCKILNWKRKGTRIKAHLECSMSGGHALLGDVSFTIRNETTLYFEDQDHTSDATLYKCPR